jgi:hypothetical protein
MSEDKTDYKVKGRPKSDFPTKAIRVPEVLVPAVEQMVEAFKKTVSKEKKEVKKEKE